MNDSGVAKCMPVLIGRLKIKKQNIKKGEKK